MIPPAPLGRRDFLRTAASAAAAAVLPGQDRPSLSEVIGITTGGLNHQRENAVLTVSTLPRFVRDELGMRLIDLNTRWLTSFEEGYVARARETAEKAGCFITNLKVNHSFGDLASKDGQERARAMTNARHLVLTAQRLGARWIRFGVPKAARKDPSAHRELAGLARERGLQLLVENSGWMGSDPGSVIDLVRAIGKNAAAGPDTGNWDDDVRYKGLALTFPGAATCDFKVFDLDKDRKHRKYDIKRCFDIGWMTGFRGPWAIEHWNEDLKAFARETVHIRELLKSWMREAKKDRR